jgi:hypothetical protein
MKYKTWEEHWTEVDKNYDWEWQKTVMWYLDHKWALGEIPQIIDLKDMVKHLMNSAWRPDTVQTSSGGFTVKYWHEEDNFEVWYTPPGLHWETNP